MWIQPFVWHKHSSKNTNEQGVAAYRCSVLSQQLLTLHVFHDHAQMAPCFKGAIHADDKGVFCKSQDIPLHKSLLDLVSKDEVLFINFLHGKSLPRFLMPNKIDCPENSTSIGVHRRMFGGYTKSCAHLLF